jgi:hypothetical protein
MQDGQGRTALGSGRGMEWHGICWKSSDVPPDEAAGARIGTAEAAGGRTPWDLRMWVGGRRVSAGGGMGFAAVAAGEGPRAKGGGLAGGRSAGRYAGVWPLSWAIGNVKQILEDKSPDLKSNKRSVFVQRLRVGYPK